MRNIGINNIFFLLFTHLIKVTYLPNRLILRGQGIHKVAPNAFG